MAISFTNDTTFITVVVEANTYAPNKTRIRMEVDEPILHFYFYDNPKATNERLISVDFSDVASPAEASATDLMNTIAGWLVAISGATPAAHASTHNNGGSDEITVTGLSGLLADAQKVEVVKNSGAVVGTQKQLNFIEGANITLTVTNDPGNSQVDITIASSGGGGVSDGDKGDITVSSSGTVWTIDDEAVTYAKMQNVSATDKILGRSSSGAGDVEEIACTAAGRAILDDANAAAQRTTLGATMVGANLFTVADPSAIRYIRINADNSVSLLDAAAMLAAIGGQASGTYLTAANNLSDVASAGTSRTNLGATTVGSNLFTVSDPGAIRFIRINADNTVSLLSDTAFTTAISAATLTGTETLTNKRVTKRTGTVASSATPTINTDNVDFYSITALAASITSFTTNLSGTPTEGQFLWIAITDNGTSRSIAWGASFEASTVPLPTATTISTRLDVGFVWNTVTSKWRIVASC